MKDCRTLLRLQSAVDSNKEHVREERVQVRDIKNNV
jgi:hypothetical protein